MLRRCTGIGTLLTWSSPQLWNRIPVSLQPQVASRHDYFRKNLWQHLKTPVCCFVCFTHHCSVLVPINTQNILTKRRASLILCHCAHHPLTSACWFEDSCSAAAAPPFRILGLSLRDFDESIWILTFVHWFWDFDCKTCWLSHLRFPFSPSTQNFLPYHFPTISSSPSLPDLKGYWTDWKLPVIKYNGCSYVLNQLGDSVQVTLVGRWFIHLVFIPIYASMVTYIAIDFDC